MCDAVACWTSDREGRLHTIQTAWVDKCGLLERRLERTAHALAVGDVLADLEMDRETIAAALLHDVVEDLVESIIRNPDALQLVSRLRESDESAYTHALQVAVLLVTFGRELGFSRMELEHLGQVGMLLDIGKLRIPREILSKRGNLTPDEFE
ncbi:HD domain-containing protein, partial [Lacticaseibacillus rhamnosus]